MTTLSRRQILLGGGAMMASGLVPGVNLINAAFGEEIPRPDYLIRAGYNENPWGPSRVALKAIANAMKRGNQYGADTDSVLDLMSAINNIPVDHISIGTGSGEILRTAGMLAAMDEGSVVCADPTYHDLTRHAERNGSEIIRVPVKRDDMSVDLNAMYNAIRRDTKCIYIANPNNPIPTIVEKNALRDFALEVSKDRLVFIDEAYFEFVNNDDYSSMMDLVRDGHRNIVVARTASKIHGLAGNRVGFGYAHPELTARINRTKTSAHNVLSLPAVHASYQDQEFQDFTIRKNREAMDIVEKGLDEMDARYIKSNTNFTFVYTGQDVSEVGKRFREENIMVGRPFPPMNDWLRVSMAKPDEMKYFVQTYRKLLS